MPQHVTVSDYSPEWPLEYEREAAALARVFGGNLAAIHHIGSTAVPGLAAKPIIDIMPVVYSLEAVDALSAGFEALGYEYLGEFGIPGRRYMRRGGDERTHQVHVFSVLDTAQYKPATSPSGITSARTRTYARNTPRSSAPSPENIPLTSGPIATARRS